MFFRIHMSVGQYYITLPFIYETLEQGRIALAKEREASRRVRLAEYTNNTYTRGGEFVQYVD